MENHHHGLNLILKLRGICRRAAAEGKTIVRPATLHLIDKQIRQMRKAPKQAELFSA